MLFFVGLGLYDEKDISVKGLETVKKADLIYTEFYTSRLMGTSLERLEDFYGADIHLLAREEVEVKPDWLIDAKNKDIVFLIGGDPMISTTHLDLRLRAAEMGIDTKIIHSSSIVSAVSGLTGLQNYRFGKSTSIPFPYMAQGKRIVPETPYRVMMENLNRDLHTLLFLDLQDERCMTINQGIEHLLEAEKQVGGVGLIDILGVGIAGAGSDKPRVKADTLGALKNYDFGGPLHTLIIPAKLHFLEATALVILAGAPKNIAKETDM